MSGFDQLCPNCCAKIDCHSAWLGSDYLTEFKYVCPECDECIRILVHMVPEFETAETVCEKCGVDTDCSPRPYCQKCLNELQQIANAAAARTT